MKQKNNRTHTAKKSIEEIKEILKMHKSELKQKFAVKEIGIFGSYVRGEQNENSDIDFVVEFDLNHFNPNFKGLYDAYIDLSEYFEKLFGKKVEILTPESIDTIRVKEVADEIKRSIVYV